MIAFIEGGMRIPMDRVTRDFLIACRLYLTQCSLNVFRILSSMVALNEKMGINSPIMMLTGYIIASSLRVRDTILKLGSLKLDSSCVFPKLTRAWTKIF